MWQLDRQADGLRLIHPNSSMLKPFRLDFDTAQLRQRTQQSHTELLLKAIGKTRQRILDATLGFGRDAFIMASFGHELIGIEQSIPLFQLLQDARFRAQQKKVPGADRLYFLQGNALAIMPLLAPVDVVYLDPLFPLRTKRARVKKEATILQDLGVTCSEDHPQLLRLARAKATKRVVVKRPIRAPCLTEDSVHHQIVGKTIRFDVYLPL